MPVWGGLWWRVETPAGRDAVPALPEGEPGEAGEQGKQFVRVFRTDSIRSGNHFSKAFDSLSGSLIEASLALKGRDNKIIS